jgi:hypothetical protein
MSSHEFLKFFGPNLDIILFTIKIKKWDAKIGFEPILGLRLPRLTTALQV